MPFIRSRKLAVNDDNSGYTMLEVMTAMAIFAIGFLALARLQLSLIHANTASGLQSKGTILAAQCMDRLMILPYNHTDLNPSNHTGGETAYSAGLYNVQWHVSQDHTLKDIKTIRVTVIPLNRAGRPVTMSAHKARED